jgi:hypothetical protein
MPEVNKNCEVYSIQTPLSMTVMKLADLPLGLGHVAPPQGSCEHLRSMSGVVDPIDLHHLQRK